MWPAGSAEQGGFGVSSGCESDFEPPPVDHGLKWFRKRQKLFILCSTQRYLEPWKKLAIRKPY